MSSFKKQASGFATKAIHAGQDPEKWSHMSVVPPIVMSSTFKQYGPADFKLYEYGRSGNPTRNVLEECLAALDNAKYALTFASGMGAMTSITQLLECGDHIIACDDMYGGSYRFLSKIATKSGIEVDFVDMTDLNNLQKAIKANTKMVWIETPTNPLLKLIDIATASKIVKSSSEGIFLVVDNTFLTSYFQRPLELGADISMYSLTKYTNGHSDIVMGAACLNDNDLYSRLKFLQNASGIVPSPFDSYQVNRSLKTLQIRMEQHSKSSIVIAKYLEAHPYIIKVIHPGLPSHPQHKLAIEQQYGHSGIMAFYLKGGLAESTKFLKALNTITLAESLGGYESLAELPSVMTHASIPEERRKELGITDNLLRLSVGLEDPLDLVDDLEQALQASQK